MSIISNPLLSLAIINLDLSIDLNLHLAKYPWRTKDTDVRPKTQCSGSWKKGNTEEALKCWNLERIINAEQQGKDAPSELNMEDLLNDKPRGALPGL